MPETVWKPRAGSWKLSRALHLSLKQARTVWIIAAVMIATFILYTHRINVRRLRVGTEHRFERARVLARLFSP
jgi:glycerol-3-phosphate acyltransferase PlsY